EDRQTAYGITNVAEARVLGFSLLDVGPFGHGGIKNNLEISFVTRGLIPEAIDLHENKVIKVLSDKLGIYTDFEGNVWTYFLVKALTRTPRGELIVTAQAFKGVAARAVCSYVTWTNQTNGVAEPNGMFRKTTGRTIVLRMPAEAVMGVLDRSK